MQIARCAVFTFELAVFPISLDDLSEIFHCPESVYSVGKAVFRGTVRAFRLFRQESGENIRGWFLIELLTESRGFFFQL